MDLEKAVWTKFRALAQGQRSAQRVSVFVRPTWSSAISNHMGSSRFGQIAAPSKVL